MILENVNFFDVLKSASDFLIFILNYIFNFHRKISDFTNRQFF